MASLGLCCCVQAFSSCGEWGLPSSCSMRASCCRGFSCCSSQPLELRLTSCDSQAYLLRVMWDLPRPRIEPVFPALQGGFLTTGPLGKLCLEDYCWILTQSYDPNYNYLLWLNFLSGFKFSLLVLLYHDFLRVEEYIFSWLDHAFKAGDLRIMGLIPGSGRSPGEENGNPRQYSCLENPMNQGNWGAIVHSVAKSQTPLKQLSMFSYIQESFQFSSLIIVLKWSLSCQPFSKCTVSSGMLSVVILLCSQSPTFFNLTKPKF